MLTRVSEKSVDEKDRRKGRLVFRGYAEFAQRGEPYAIPCRDRLLIEASTHDAAEADLRSADLPSITLPTCVHEGFRIIEIHPDDPFSNIQEWRNDSAMNLAGHLIHGRRIRFKGREATQCRFAMDELVECRYQDSIVLGCVIELPLSPVDVTAGRVRDLAFPINADFARVEFYADQSDDVYTVEYLDMDDHNYDPECKLHHPPALKA